MDTAILLFGHYRTFDYTLGNWKNYLDKGATFFLHTWSDSFAPGSQNSVKLLSEENKSNLFRFDKNAVIENQETLNLSSVQRFPSYFAAHSRAALSLLQRLFSSQKVFKRIIISRYDVLVHELPFAAENEAIITFKKIPSGVFLPDNSFNDLLLVLNSKDVRAYADSYQHLELLEGGGRFEDILDQRLTFAKLVSKKSLEVGVDVDILRFNPLGGFLKDAQMEHLKNMAILGRRIGTLLGIAILILIVFLVARKVLIKNGDRKQVSMVR
jgi:hypothetical protein